MFDSKASANAFSPALPTEPLKKTNVQMKKGVIIIFHIQPFPSSPKEWVLN